MDKSRQGPAKSVTLLFAGFHIAVFSAPCNIWTCLMISIAKIYFCDGFNLKLPKWSYFNKRVRWACLLEDQSFVDTRILLLEHTLFVSALQHVNLFYRSVSTAFKAVYLVTLPHLWQVNCRRKFKVLSIRLRLCQTFHLHLIGQRKRRVYKALLFL